MVYLSSVFQHSSQIVSPNIYTQNGQLFTVSILLSIRKLVWFNAHQSIDGTQKKRVKNSRDVRGFAFQMYAINCRRVINVSCLKIQPSVTEQALGKTCTLRSPFTCFPRIDLPTILQIKKKKKNNFDLTDFSTNSMI